MPLKRPKLLFDFGMQSERTKTKMAWHTHLIGSQMSPAGFRKSEQAATIWWHQDGTVPEEPKWLPQKVQNADRRRETLMRLLPTKTLQDKINDMKTQLNQGG